MPISYPCVLTTGQLARCLGVARRKIHDWIRDGQLRAYRLPGGNQDRRIELADALAFAERHELLTAALRDLGEQHGVCPRGCPSLLLLAPFSEAHGPRLATYFEITTVFSPFQAGLLLARREFAVILIDTAIGRQESREILWFLHEHAPHTCTSVLAGEDESQLLGWMEYGASSAWQKPCDLTAVGQALLECLRDWQPGKPTPRRKASRAAA